MAHAPIGGFNGRSFYSLASEGDPACRSPRPRSIIGLEASIP
jgi:hypothetical protein